MDRERDEDRLAMDSNKDLEHDLRRRVKDLREGEFDFRPGEDLKKALNFIGLLRGDFNLLEAVKGDRDLVT